MSTSSLCAPPTQESTQKLKEAQLKIGMALKNAQYALSTHGHRGLAAALTENVSALTALSTYLSLSGSPVKAAAIAGQMAKILKSVGTYVASKERSSGASHHVELSSHSSAPDTPSDIPNVLHESAYPPGAPSESAGQVADLQKKIQELTRQRDAAREEKCAVEMAWEEYRQKLTTVTPCGAGEAEASDTADEDAHAVIRRLRAEVDDLKHGVRKEHTRAAALQDQLHEAEEQMENQLDELQALRLQLRLSQQEKVSLDASFAKKDEEIKALQEALLQNSRTGAAPLSKDAAAAARATPAGAQPPPGYVDKDDFEALKLQNQLLQDALRNPATQARPTDPHTILSQQTLEEIEADHQQQLQAMKLTIHEQYNRETELLEKQRTMQETIDDLNRQLQLSSNRKWVQQEREKHLSEMDAANLQIQDLQLELDNRNRQIATQQTQLADLLASAAAEREQHEDRVAELERAHASQVAELEQQLEMERDNAAASQSSVAERESALQQRLADLRASAAAEREQHEDRVVELERAHASQVAELEQQLEMERDNAAASQSSVAERESALQQRLADLRASAAAEREQHEDRVAELERAHASQVAELQQQLEMERSAAIRGDCEGRRNVKGLADAVESVGEGHRGALEKLKREHSNDIEGGQSEVAAGVAEAAELAEKLRIENRVLTDQVRELEEKHKAVTVEKIAAGTKLRDAEQLLSTQKNELRRLREECDIIQNDRERFLEERDAVVKKLKDAAQVAEEAQAYAVRLEALRTELLEVQGRLDTADKDKAIVMARCKRVSMEKDECAEAARKLLTQYKEMALAREQLMAQLATAEALAEEKSREVEELSHAATLHADIQNDGAQRNELEAKQQMILEDTKSEKQKRIDALVVDLDAAARANQRLKSELDTLKARLAEPQGPPLSAEPASSQPLPSRDMPDSLGKMHLLLNTMHMKLVPIIETLSGERGSHAAGETSPSASVSAVRALQELYTAMEKAHAATRISIENSEATARRLRLSVSLQSLVYGKLLFALQHSPNTTGSSAILPALVDVALVRACAALLNDACLELAPDKEESVRHGAPKLGGDAKSHIPPGNGSSSSVRGYIATAMKGRIDATTASDQHNSSTWLHHHAFTNTAPALSLATNRGNQGMSVNTEAPARQLRDDRNVATVGYAELRRQSTRAALQRRSSLENFAVAQAASLAVEERAGLRTAPNPSWK